MRTASTTPLPLRLEQPRYAVRDREGALLAAGLTWDEALALLIAERRPQEDRALLRAA